MPREDLNIKEQRHKQWGEEKMIEKEGTRLEKYEPIFETMLVCLSCSEHFPRLFLSFVVYLSVLPCCFLENKKVVLKFFNVFCRLAFNPRG